MAPVIRVLRQTPDFRMTVLGSGQHRDLLEPLLDWFGIRIQRDLGVMIEGQSLAGLTARLMTALDACLAETRPDLVVAQGDTTTVMCAALCCFYRNIPFAHVEAGLRTFDLRNPFPEEFNRALAGKLARFHFCPTRRAAENLAKEGVDAATVFVTGNTVIDALHDTVSRLPPSSSRQGKRQILLTMHRRESFGAPLERVCAALLRLCRIFSDLSVLYPVHPNPQVKRPVSRLLAGHPRIRLVEPLGYPELVAAMRDSYFILTDSGGIQEEAPALGKPVLVLREVTERPEAMELGVAKLVGTDPETIVAEAARLLEDSAHYQAMARGGSPYGDGRAAQRIRDILAERL